MVSETQERWRPSTRFLLAGAVISIGIGLLVGILTRLGAGDLNLVYLGWNGFAGLLVFLVICGILTAVLHRIHSLSGLRRALALAGVFFVGGAVAWLVLHSLLVVSGLARIPTWSQIAANIGVNGVLAILFGSGFYLYEAMRQQLLESAFRLREAEFAEKELALARSIQNRLLPPTELSGEGYRIAARNLPARFVAGDFFDVFSLPDGALGLVVADVAGKGVGASLIMASVKAMLPLLAAGATVAETLIALNHKLCDELESRQFVALAYARYEPATGELILANAGLPDPYLLRPGAGPEPLSVEGPRMPLGLRRDQAYLANSATLSPGEGLLLLTDGLPEAPDPNGEPLGYEALAQLMPPMGSEPGAWLDDLIARVRQGTASELTDDWTALRLERNL